MKLPIFLFIAGLTMIGAAIFYPACTKTLKPANAITHDSKPTPDSTYNIPIIHMTDTVIGGRGWGGGPKHKHDFSNLNRMPCPQK